MTRGLLLLAAALLVNACALFGDGGCPCGSDTSDPIASHDLAYGGDHVVDGGCICQCGNGDPEVFADDRACHEYETNCETASGATLRYECY